MKVNESKTDRQLRVLVGFFGLLFSLVVGISSFWGVVLLVVGVLALGTAAVGFCPLYAIFGIDTERTYRANHPEGQHSVSAR